MNMKKILFWGIVIICILAAAVIVFDKGEIFDSNTEIEVTESNNEEIPISNKSIKLYIRKGNFSYKKINISDEEKVKINDYYENCSEIPPEETMSLAILGSYKIVFEDGTELLMDSNSDSVGSLKEKGQSERLIRLSDGFKEYIRNLADNN